MSNSALPFLFVLLLYEMSFTLFLVFFVRCHLLCFFMRCHLLCFCMRYHYSVSLFSCIWLFLFLFHNTFSQSWIWSVTNFRYPWSSVVFFFSYTAHPFMGISSRKIIMISRMQYHNTLLIVFILCVIELVAPCGNVHIRTNPIGVCIVVMSRLSTASCNWS